MKTSDVLRAAKLRLVSARNPFGETHVLAAIHAVDDEAEKAQAVFLAACAKMVGRPCYYLSEAMRRVGWIPAHRRPSDPLFWPIRDGWLDKLIIECEKNGD